MEHYNTLLEILVQPPKPEAEITEGMHILYAEAYPNLALDVQFTTVKKVRNVGGLVFDGVTRSGEKGKYTLITDLLGRMQMVEKSTQSNTCIFDHYGESCLQPETKIAYGNGVLVATWENSEPGEWRLKNPGVGFEQNDNTLSYDWQPGDSWRLEQRFPNGPEGSFTQLGFREVPEEKYQRLVQFVEEYKR